MNNQDPAEVKKAIKQAVQKMNPEYRDYFSGMERYIYSDESYISDIKRDNIVLKLANSIITNQNKGISPQDAFGSDPVAYSRQLLDDIVMRRPRTLKDKIKYYIMIPWVALTWVFFIYMVFGFIGKWIGAEDLFTEINSSTLLLIAVLSIVLIQAVTSLMGTRTDSTTEDAGINNNMPPRKFDLRALGIYIGIAVAAVALGQMLSQFMPILTLTPWQHLVLVVIGFMGYFIFLRRRD